MKDIPDIGIALQVKAKTGRNSS